jgi:hypothetical protein
MIAVAAAEIRNFFYSVSSVVSVSLRWVPRLGTTSVGSLTFSFLGGELKRVDMNANRMASSEIVYFELTDLRLHIRTTIRNKSPAIKLGCVRFFNSERIRRERTIARPDGEA